MRGAGRNLRLNTRPSSPARNATAYDAIIIGAGAAGLMCAAVAGQRGRRVLLLDHALAPGAKILISGGGRCNFTNLHTAPDRYLSRNPHFAKSALSRYTPADFLALVARHGIAWHEKTLGQLFCDGSARQIVAMLCDECDRGQVEVRCGISVGSVTVTRRDDGFCVATDGGDVTAPALVIATGGPSIPKLGATGFAYDLARQFGLKLVEPRPALVPLTLGGDELLFRELSGVAAEVVVGCEGGGGAQGRAGGYGKARFREKALFTHRGLSGPAILQISSYWRRGDVLGVDFTPDAQPGWLSETKHRHPKMTLRRRLAEIIPDRLALALCARLGEEAELGRMTNRRLAAIEAQLAHWRFTPNGSEGFAKAEVTVGGISTAELSSKTMEATRVPGLFVIGEAVDVTGWLGGYNFQWAWASGWAAGQAL